MWAAAEACEWGARHEADFGGFSADAAAQRVRRSTSGVSGSASTIGAARAAWKGIHRALFASALDEARGLANFVA